MQKAVFKARRLSHAGTLLVALIALVGCQTTDITTATSDFFSTLTNASETSGTAPATKQAASAEANTASAAPESMIKKSPYKWGLLSLLVGGGGPIGDDWYLFVYPTASSQNFVGVNGPMLTVANTHSVQLWPGDYRVIVRHNTVDKFDRVVTISAGETLRLTGEYGYFSNSVKSERFPFYNENQLLLATVLNRAEDIFLPVVVAWSGQWCNTQEQVACPELCGITWNAAEETRRTQGVETFSDVCRNQIGAQDQLACGLPGGLQSRKIAWRSD
jgi:hypothetical protein